MAVSGFYFAWEGRVMVMIQALMGPFLTAFMSIATLFGEEAVLVVLLGFIYWGYDKKMGERMAVNILASICLCPMIKNLFLRLRPYAVVDGVECLKPARDGDIYDMAVQGYSFPSGHACSAVTAYGTLASGTRNRAVRAVCVIITALVCLSRICLGVHFPTDVIAGAAIGIIVLAVSGLLNRDGELSAGEFLAIIAACSAGLFFCRTEDYFTSYGVLIGGLGGILFERRFVDFRNTGRFLVMLSRTAGGIVFFLAVNFCLKALFSLAGAGGYAALILRTARYALSSFAAVGVYPFSFRAEDRFGRKAA